MMIQGDVFERLPTIKPGSIDCTVTSPPYWALRSYLPKGHPLKHLEIGQEKTPQEYIAKMVRVFQLVRDCLADHGTLWVNVGDTYTHDSRGGETGGKHLEWHGEKAMSHARLVSTCDVIEAGNLALIPQRLAIALQDDGWIVRSYVIWHKPAPMPSSVSGWAWRRCRVKVGPSERIKGEKKGSSTNGRPHQARAANGKDFASTGHFGAPQTKLVGHSGYDCPNGAQWEDCPGCKKCIPNGGYVLRKGSWRPTSSYEPILMLAKTADYFCDGEPVKTPASGSSGGKAFGRILDEEGTTAAGASTRRCTKEDRERYDGGANLRDVWKISAEPLADAHYAAYPTELVRKCLLAGVSAKGYCPQCGKPWVRVIDSKAVPHPSPRSKSTAEARDAGAGLLRGGNQSNGSAALAPQVETVGWRPSCSCNAGEPRPGRVLDPFAGSGRTGIASKWLGLDFVGVELNPQYVEMAEGILRDDSPLFTEAM